MRFLKPICFLFLFTFGSLFAQGQGLFEQATQAYSEGNYKSTIVKYEQILHNGRHSVGVYYNLANAHYKLNHVAPSIYYYEKALQLAPNDEDVLNNLSFAEKMKVDIIEAVPESGFSSFVSDYLKMFHFDTWAWIAVVFSFLFAGLFIVYYFVRTPFKKRLFFIPSIFCLLLMIVFVCSAYFSKAQQESQHYAIVFAQEAKVKAEPNLRSDLVFTLHEGTKVKIKEDFGKWFEISLADGQQGWIKKETIKKL